jgi:hypothetical protein
MAWVDSVGRQMDRDVVSRFFASIRIAPAWQIRAAPTLGVAVAVPALADEETRTPERVEFVIGGKDPVIYTIALSTLPAGSTPATAPDDVKPPQGILTSSTRIEHDGLPGREWGVTRGKMYLRGRVLATESRLYWLMIVAGTPAQTTDLEANRFFESVRIF